MQRGQRNPSGQRAFIAARPTCVEAEAVAQGGDAVVEVDPGLRLVPGRERNAGDEGRLFGSIGTRDIADAITAAGVTVAKSEVRLPQGVLREIGQYEIDVQLHAEVIQAVKLAVIPE